MGDFRCRRCEEDYLENDEVIFCEDCKSWLCYNCADVDPEEEELHINGCPICLDETVKTNNYKRLTDFIKSLKTSEYNKKKLIILVDDLIKE